jgi:hypothetical protein
MSEKTGKRSRARWAVGVMGAGIAVLALAGPAAAETQVGVGVSGAVTVAGQVTLYGVYTCDATSAYAEIAVKASQPDGSGGYVQAAAYDRVACTGTPQVWEETLTSDQSGAAFTSGSLQGDVNVWTPGDWAGRSEASQFVWVS